MFYVIVLCQVKCAFVLFKVIKFLVRKRKVMIINTCR